MSLLTLTIESNMYRFVILLTQLYDEAKKKCFKYKEEVESEIFGCIEPRKENSRVKKNIAEVLR